MTDWIQLVQDGLSAIVDSNAKGPLEYKNKRVELGRIILQMREHTETLEYEYVLSKNGLTDKQAKMYIGIFLLAIRLYVEQKHR